MSSNLSIGVAGFATAKLLSCPPNQLGERACKISFFQIILWSVFVGLVAHLHNCGGQVPACGKGSRGGCGTSRWPRTSSNTFCGICFKTLFKLKCEETYVGSASIYLPSTSGAFFARVEGGSIGRGQSNRFSPYWEHRGEILEFSCCYFSSYHYFNPLLLVD